MSSKKADQERKDKKVLFAKLTDFERLPNLAPLEIEDEKEELFVDAQCSFWVQSKSYSKSVVFKTKDAFLRGY